MVYMETLLDFAFVTYANLPEGSTATEEGDHPASISPRDVKRPVVASMVYIETLSELLFATYANLPEGSTATEEGSVPAAIVPLNVSAPVVASMAYVETLLLEPGTPIRRAPFVVYTNLPDGWTATEVVPSIAPAIVCVDVSAPLAGSML